MFYTAQLILALEEVHRNKLVYRSLNPRDILMDVEGNVKLVDYGVKVVDNKDSYY